MSLTVEQIEYLGYTNPKQFADGSFAAVFKFMYTAGIVHKLDEYGYSDRWCYHSVEDAVAALDAWDGTGEPQGWHRHPKTGRRRDGSREWVAH